MDYGFENIVPWNGANDTGLDVRMKWKRNFERIKANLEELEQADSTIIDLVVEEVLNKFLRKDAPDQTEHLIKFLGGIEVGDIPIKKHSDGTLLLDGNLLLTGGVTMYADIDNPNVPSIFDGIPIDNKTIGWVDGVLSVIGGTGGGGSTTLGGLTNVGSWADTVPEADRIMVQLAGTSNWSSKPLSELTGTISGISFTGTGNAVTGASLSADKKSIILDKGETFAKKSELDAFGTKLDDFLTGTDTDGIINKWKELEHFLAGQTQTSTLADLLSVKADKATTLAGYGITDAYTKTEIDGRYVKIAGDAMTGDLRLKPSGANYGSSLLFGDSSYAYIKEDTDNHLLMYASSGIAFNTSNNRGVTIDGISIKKHADGVLHIDGDLIVTGAVTMYAQGTHTASTILDALPIDSATLSKANGKLSVIGGGGSSISGIKVNGGIYAPATDGYISLPNYPTSLAWSAITGKPETFTPSSHTHNYASTVKVGTASYNVSGNTVSLPAYPTIPTALKNPNALTIQRHGVSLGSYDGSAAKTFNITAPTWGEVTGKPTWIGTSKPSYAFSELTSHPTTLSGYGITDGYKVISGNPDNNNGMSAGFYNEVGSYASFVQSGYGGQFAMYTRAGLRYRGFNGSEGAESWRKILDSSNYTEFAYSKTDADNRYVKKAGDTMTGNLHFSNGSNGRKAAIGGNGLALYAGTGTWAFGLYAYNNGGGTRIQQLIGACGTDDTYNYTYIGGKEYTSPHIAILSSGNVGIGTINPSAKLHVAGDISVNGIPVKKHSDGVLLIDGNLLVTGGVTMYADGTSTGSGGHVASADYCSSLRDPMHHTSTTRRTSANINFDSDAGLHFFLATSSMTTGKPANDSHIIHCEWDNGNAWATQLALPANPLNDIQWRGQDGTVWSAWKTVLDSSNYTKYISTTSDRRLKTNLRKVEDAPARLLSLGSVYDFRYTDAEVQRNNTYAGEHIGLIYQNVTESPLKRMAFQREDGYGALNYLEPSFICLLAAVGQNHETRIKQLEEENEELKQKIKQMEERRAE